MVIIMKKTNIILLFSLLFFILIGCDKKEESNCDGQLQSISNISIPENYLNHEEHSSLSNERLSSFEDSLSIELISLDIINVDGIDGLSYKANFINNSSENLIIRDPISIGFNSYARIYLFSIKSFFGKELPLPYNTLYDPYPFASEAFSLSEYKILSPNSCTTISSEFIYLPEIMDKDNMQSKDIPFGFYFIKLSYSNKSLGYYVDGYSHDEFDTEDLKTLKYSNFVTRDINAWVGDIESNSILIKIP